MRYRELQRFKQHPNWYNGNGFIHLPNGSNLKRKCKQRERWIKLPSRSQEIIHLFTTMDFAIPSRQSLNENLKRWCKNASIDTKGVCIKSFRKTLVSWFVATYPQQTPQIFLNLGHTDLVSLQHYLQIPFDDNDKAGIENYIGGMKW